MAKLIKKIRYMLIRKLVGKDASSGTDFKYIRSDGENIMVRESQLWFWTPEWQKRHEDAVADLNEERSTVYETGEDFLTAIKEAIAHNEVHNS